MVAASVANKTSETACIKFCALSVSISVASRSAAASGGRSDTAGLGTRLSKLHGDVM